MARKAAIGGQARSSNRGTISDVTTVATVLPYFDAMWVDNEVAGLSTSSTSRAPACGPLRPTPGRCQRLLSPPLDAAAVADPDSHSSLIPDPLDARAGFRSRFRRSSWRVASARCNAGRRAAVPLPSLCEIARLSRSTDRSEEPSLRFPIPGAFSRELRRVPAGARHGPKAIFSLRAGLAVVGVGRDPRPATSPEVMRTQDVPTPSLDRDTRAETEHPSVRVYVRLQPAVQVTEDQDVTGDHQPLASLGSVALRSERRRVVARRPMGRQKLAHRSSGWPHVAG
jgi:hypothetical protein